MASDPRTVLDAAAQRRASIQLRPRKGEWVSGTLTRVEKAGVVVSLSEPRLQSGEDVTAWLRTAEGSWTFDASVLRVGVPVPDRSPHGVLLGFLEGWSEGAPVSESTPERWIELLPSHGRGVRPERIVELTPSNLEVSVSHEVALKFVEGGRVRVRFVDGGREHVAEALVRRLSPGEGHYLYGFRFDAVEDEAEHLAFVERFRPT